jgi:hypothetical protein
MKKSSEKSFGILFSLVFFLIAFWPMLNQNPIRIWALILSFIFLVIVFFKKDLLKPLNLAWIKIGEILGKIVAPTVMLLIYFVVLTPISLATKMFGKDLLKLKFSKNNSYWIKREKDINTMDKQF